MEIIYIMCLHENVVEFFMCCTDCLLFFSAFYWFVCMWVELLFKRKEMLVVWKWFCGSCSGWGLESDTPEAVFFCSWKKYEPKRFFFFSLSLTCTVRDVCVVCGFFPSYIEEIKAEKRRSAVNREPQLESGFAASAGFSGLFFFILKSI